MVYSSNPNFPHDSNWHTNGAGLKGSHLYGFGILDSAVLVNRARNWITVPPRLNCTLNITPQLEGNKIAVNGKPLTARFRTDGCGLSYLEHVQVVTTLSILSKYRGSVSIELTSPKGTKSTLLPYRNLDYHRDGFHKWPFMTVLTWGENPVGNWIFTVTTKNGAVASVDGLELVFYGVYDVPAAVQLIPEQIECHEQCHGKCARTGAEFCDTCRKFREASSHKCVEKCSTGTYQNIHMCQDCPDFCDECTDDQICIKCQKGTVKLETGDCVSECPTLSYAAVDGNCIRCHHSCLSCDGPTESNCTDCLDHLSLREDGTCAKCSGKESTHCTHCQDPYTLTEDGRCVDIRQMRSCDLGHYYNISASSCLPCPFMCANCSEDSKCLSCAGEYYLLSGGTCVEACPEHTVVDNQTHACLDTVCHKSCLTCFGTDDNQCISCSRKLILFEGSCIKTCPSSTYETKDTCHRCHRNCAECVGPNANECLSCPDGTYQQANHCVKMCPLGTFSGPEGVCVACPENCVNCSVANKCTTCSSGYFLLTTNGTCVSKCPPGFATEAPTYTCYPCLPNCIKCPDSHSCQKCADSFYYYEPNQSCLSQCPDGFFSDSKSTLCSPCNTLCSTCSDSPSNRLGCNGNFALNLTSKTCEKCCNADSNNAVPPCCDCNFDDNLCVWINLPTPRTNFANDDGGTLAQAVGSLFKDALMVTIVLLLLMILTIALMIGIRYSCTRAGVKMPDVKFSSLRGSHRYTILSENDGGALELQDSTYTPN